MDDPQLFSDHDKLKAVERELALRRAVYPRWVAQGRLKAAAAGAEIAVMVAIRDDYLRRLNGAH